MAVAISKLVPEFEANATSGIKITHLSHQGSLVVLFFYPKDHTPGCTTEAMEFGSKYAEFAQMGVHVFGVSRDNMKSHEDFKSKLNLPFDLIADTEEKMCHMFGVVKNKIMYGRKVKGIERSTFLISAEGRLLHEWRGLKVAGHVDEVLAFVRTLAPSKNKKAIKKSSISLDDTHNDEQKETKTTTNPPPTSRLKLSEATQSQDAATKPTQLAKTSSSGKKTPTSDADILKAKTINQPVSKKKSETPPAAKRSRSATKK